MRLNLTRAALAAAILAAPAAAFASDPGPRDEPRQPRPAQAERSGQRPAQPELICRSVEIAGSAGTMPMVCMTAADWQREGQ